MYEQFHKSKCTYQIGIYFHPKGQIVASNIHTLEHNFIQFHTPDMNLFHVY